MVFSSVLAMSSQRGSWRTYLKFCPSSVVLFFLCSCSDESTLPKYLLLPVGVMILITIIVGKALLLTGLMHAVYRELQRAHLCRCWRCCSRWRRSLWMRTWPIRSPPASAAPSAHWRRRARHSELHLQHNMATKIQNNTQ